MRNLLSSQWGRAFEALRDSPIATDAMGVGTYRHKVAAFALGSGLGGLAGGALRLQLPVPAAAGFVYELTVILLLGVVLGGRKSLWGAFVGAVARGPAPQPALQPAALPGLLRRRASRWRWPPASAACAQRTTRPFQALAPIVATGLLVVGGLVVKNTEDWRKAIFALMLFSVVVGLPEGLMGFAAGFLARLFRVAPAAAARARRRSTRCCRRRAGRRRAAARGAATSSATSAA